MLHEPLYATGRGVFLVSGTLSKQETFTTRLSWSTRSHTRVPAQMTQPTVIGTDASRNEPSQSTREAPKGTHHPPRWWHSFQTSASGHRGAADTELDDQIYGTWKSKAQHAALLQRTPHKKKELDVRDTAILQIRDFIRLIKAAQEGGKLNKSTHRTRPSRHVISRCVNTRPALPTARPKPLWPGSMA